VLKYLEQINREDGITVMCNLHFLDLARRYGTRIVALKEGRLIFDGLPSEIDRRRFKEIYGEEAEEVGVN
jgi:phosphonate transport system ATP-binding protein